MGLTPDDKTPAPWELEKLRAEVAADRAAAEPQRPGSKPPAEVDTDSALREVRRQSQELGILRERLDEGLSGMEHQVAELRRVVAEQQAEISTLRGDVRAGQEEREGLAKLLEQQIALLQGKGRGSSKPPRSG